MSGARRRSSSCCSDTAWQLRRLFGPFELAKLELPEEGGSQGAAIARLCQVGEIAAENLVIQPEKECAGSERCKRSSLGKLRDLRNIAVRWDVGLHYPTGINAWKLPTTSV
jgi:hypothetical protein